MQHLALAYCPTSCPLVSSRLPLLPVILFTYLGIFSLCPLLFNPMALYVIALIPGLPSPYTITAPQNQSSRQQTFLETQYAPWLATTRTSFRFIAFFSREPYFFLHRCQLEAQRAFLPCVRHLAQGRTSPLWSQGCSKYLSPARSLPPMLQTYHLLLPPLQPFSLQRLTFPVPYTCGNLGRTAGTASVHAAQFRPVVQASCW